MKRIIMIDNYDSFTYNLVQAFGILGAELKVFRNDRVSFDEIEKFKPDRIVISPGPGKPKTAGISNEVIKTFGAKIITLGVCLGHQCIGEVFGARVVNAKRIMHGKTSQIYHDGEGIFEGIPNPFIAMRYHSLALSEQDFPDCLRITAKASDGEIMGIEHKNFKIFGVQFHPESFLTHYGLKLLENFLKENEK